MQYVQWMSKKKDVGDELTHDCYQRCLDILTWYCMMRGLCNQHTSVTLRFYTHAYKHTFSRECIYIYIYTVLPMDIVWSPTRAWKSKTVTEQFMYCTLKASPNTSVPYSRAWTTVLYAFRIRFLCVQWSVSSATSLIVVCLFLHFLHVPTFSELHFTAILEDGAIFNI